MIEKPKCIFPYRRQGNVEPASGPKDKRKQIEGRTFEENSIEDKNDKRYIKIGKGGFIEYRQETESGLPATCNEILIGVAFIPVVEEWLQGTILTRGQITIRVWKEYPSKKFPLHFWRHFNARFSRKKNFQI